MSHSALYLGTVVHQRTRPRHHRLQYRFAQVLIDLAEIENIARKLRFFSHNRFNLFSIHDRDLADRSASDLRTQIETLLQRAGLDIDGGPIRVLTMPRTMGHVFNPISTWFCYSTDEELRATVYEVTNTFGDRHFYVIPVAPSPAGAVRQTCDKSLYVSPFADMDLHYDFSLRPPGSALSLIVRASDRDGPIITASFVAKRQPLSDRALLRLALSLPFMTMKVVLAIHWQAIRLWLKGIRIRRHPAPPPVSMTIGRRC